MRVVLDIDGVLANWNSSYRHVLIKHGAAVVPLDPLPDHPVCWHWPQQYGATAEQDRAAWDWVRTNPAWWGQLPVHPDMDQIDARQLVKAVCQRHEVTFVTSRPCGRPETVRWLAREFGVPAGVPTILCMQNKAHILAGMHPHAVVEDRLSTLQEWAETGQGVAYLVDRPYNRTADPLNEAILRVPSSVVAFEALLR